MSRWGHASLQLSKLKKFTRGYKLLGFVPNEDAASETDSSGSNENEEIKQREYFSSEAPSLNSSLECLDIDDSVDEIENSVPEDTVPLTPIIKKVLLRSGKINYDNIPSISSIISIPSPAPANPNVSAIQEKTSTSSSPATQQDQSPASVAPITPASVAPTIPATIAPKTRSKRTMVALVNIFQKKRKTRVPINYSWKKTQFKHKAVIPEDEFVFSMLDGDSPLDYFYKYFSVDIIQDIVMHTNLFSVQNTAKSINLTEDEFKDFLSILLIMGVVCMPSYLDYWSNELRYPLIADVMPLKRFQLIRRNLHFADNTCPDSDRYYKVRPFVEKVRQNCLATEEEMRYSIDEMTIPYKGKKAGNRKQYNPKKPDPWGFKNVVQAGMSGIVYDFILYAGEDTFRYINFTEDEENLTLGAKLVVALCKTIQTRACVVYFDNYFSTLDLTLHLRNDYGIFSLGTIRQDRLKGCEKLLMSDRDMKKKGRDTFSQMVDNDNKLAVVKWFDNKIVTLVSSYADAYPVEKIKRYSKEHKAKIDVDCPQLVKHYNHHMGGVDLSDKLISLYRTTYKSPRWYTGIFAQMLDICVNNAWLVYRRNCQRRRAQHINLKTFRCRLSRELRQKGRPSKTVPATNKSVQVIQNAVKPRPSEAIRYDGVGHWQDFTTYGRCKYCTSNKSDVYCVKCNQRLCFVRKRICFYKFHNKL